MKKVRVFLKGEYLNHYEEKFSFKAVKESEDAKKAFEELQRQMKIPYDVLQIIDPSQEYGHDSKVIEVQDDCKFVYVVWLNELSRKYAGNEIMIATSDEKAAIDEFINTWKHQGERWGFSKRVRIPKIDFSKSDVFWEWRDNEGDCDQTIGIIKLTIDRVVWRTVVEQKEII